MLSAVRSAGRGRNLRPAVAPASEVAGGMKRKLGRRARAVFVGALGAGVVAGAFGPSPADTGTSVPVPETVTVPAGAFVFGSDGAEREAAYGLDEAAYGHARTRELRMVRRRARADPAPMRSRGRRSPTPSMAPSSRPRGIRRPTWTRGRGRATAWRIPSSARAGTLGRPVGRRPAARTIRWWWCRATTPNPTRVG